MYVLLRSCTGLGTFKTALYTGRMKSAVGLYAMLMTCSGPNKSKVDLLGLLRTYEARDKFAVGLYDLLRTF